MRTAWWWLAISVVAVIVAGCGGRGGEESKGTGAAATVTIVGKDNLYEPETVEIKAGREYEFVLKNVGAGAHNLIVQSKDKVGQDFSSDLTVNPNDESKFKIKIDQVGTYPMQCTLHTEMKGTLKVVR